MRQRRKLLISLEDELHGVTEEAHPVAPISAIRNGNVTLAGNDALLKKKPDVLCMAEKRTKSVNLFCSR